MCLISRWIYVLLTHVRTIDTVWITATATPANALGDTSAKIATYQPDL